MEEAHLSRLASIVAVSGCVTFSLALLLYHHRNQKQLLLRSLGEKPQRKFKRVLADNSSLPFCHLHPQGKNVAGSQHGHPYGDVIRALAEEPWKLSDSIGGDNGIPPAIEGEASWVQTRGQLEKLVELLSEEKEIGVDTEQHSTHSFLGFTALIQISTPNTDFLLDAIALHDDMHLLQPIFANPAICKVFHGADSDILWLQRDFHIYIANLFDTARACDVLGKPQRSLAYLLQTYCGIAVNKVYQRADWRLRPLSTEMEQYARTDAHYLLYIAHCLRAELLQPCGRQENGDTWKHKDLMTEVVRRSNLLCLQLYEKDGIGVSSTILATSLLARFHSYQSSVSLAELQKLVIRLCEWRDLVARKEDESLRAVLSDAALVAVAAERPLSHASICYTIATADAVSQAPSESFLLAGMPGLPSPSPVLHKHISSLSGILSEFTEESVQSSSVTNTYRSAFRMNIFGYQFRSSVLSMLGWANELGSRNEGHREDGSSIQKKGEWERKIIPKRWRLGNAQWARLQFVRKFSCKAPVYHNCRIFAGDGRLLCYCDRKKLEWYVNRGLAEYVEGEPPAVRLLFEPKGRPEDENNEFYIQGKTNRCVGCGETSHYLRYRIIPSCYRQHFPEHLKSHRSHDIVLLCVDCHEIAHRAAERYKRQIAIEFAIPLFTQRIADPAGNDTTGSDGVVPVVQKKDVGVSPIQLRNAAMALLRHGTSMPVERRKELEEVVRQYYGGREIGPEDLTAALLVGMGPREHRRLSKKKRLFENPNYLSKEMQVEVQECNTIADNVSEELSTTGAAQRQQMEQLARNGGQEFEFHEGESLIKFSQLQQHEEEKEHDEEELPPSQTVMLSNRIHGEDAAAQGFDDASSFPTSRRSLMKDSLLGHGPHGRQVVNILMAESGDLGIAKFCERWRAVFVESVQPTFLPPGWDISHSGRREFGDFSIYNPERRNLKH
ncbi:unnamed protein product [Sphagnum balticum]